MTRSARAARPVFWRLDGRIGWRMSEENSIHVCIDELAGVLRLGTACETVISPVEPGGTFGGMTRPTGLAVGMDGRLFLADPAGNQILSYTTHEAAFVPLWTSRAPAPAGSGPLPSRHPGAAGLKSTPASEDRWIDPPDAFTLRQPRGVAISLENDLVVADTGNHRVVIYTWPNLVPRHIIDFEEGMPWDLAYDSNGLLYVADPVAGRVQRFDRLWRRDEAYQGGVGNLQRPRHLTIDATDQLFVVDEGLGQIVALDRRGQPLFDSERERFLNDRDLHLYRRTFPLPLRLDHDGLWLRQDARPRCPELLLVGLEVDRKGRLSGSDLRATGRPLLLARPTGFDYPRQGTFMTETLDSELFNCIWHRLQLDAVVPDGTSITMRTYTAAAALEPERIAALSPDRWSTPITLIPGDLPEALFQSPPGRYLWLRLDLRGNGRDTPLIHAVKLYAPRESSLAYLPPVFHEDSVSADFLDRLLSYFDTVFDEIETQIERFSGYLDPDGAPGGEFLNWLGSWFDLTFLNEWSDERRRTFVRRAVGLYKQRGTLAGLQAILRLHAGLRPPHPVVVEHFRLRNYAARREHGTNDLVDDSLYLAGAPLQPTPTVQAHHFTIFLPDQAAPDDRAVETLHRLIEAQKPAHTRYALRLVRAGLRLGCQSTVGVDTLVGGYPAAPLGEMALGQNSRLASPASSLPHTGQSRLFTST